MIKVLVDTSFSMKELGKKDSIEMVLKSLIDEFEEYNLKYQILDFEGNDLDYKSFKLDNKKLNFDLLDDNTIIVSDGLFEVKDLKKGISVTIGIDANLLNLKKLTKKVFNIDEILEIIDYILFNFELMDKNLEENNDEW
jgi:hypothetical protein